jgi:hypothetical protein
MVVDPGVHLRPLRSPVGIRTTDFVGKVHHLGDELFVAILYFLFQFINGGCLTVEEITNEPLTTGAILPSVNVNV